MNARTGQQMTAVVQLVVSHLGPALKSFDLHMRVQIAVRLLRFANDFQDLVQLFEDFWILIHTVNINRGFHPFVKVAIMPKHALGFALLKSGEGVRPRIDGDGSQTRDFTYVEDVARGCRLAMEEKGVDYDLIDVDILQGMPPEQFKRHPFGKVPAFEHDGMALYETCAVERYVDEAFDGPEATGFEWLSRDADEVQKYVEDPMCGFVLRTGSLVNLFTGAREAARAENIATIPTDLPIYVFCGADDPVHNEGKSLERLQDRYRAAGLNVRLKLYPGGRHEMFNEINSEEVVGDLVSYLDALFG